MPRERTGAGGGGQQGEAVARTVDGQWRGTRRGTNRAGEAPGSEAAPMPLPSSRETIAPPHT
ncbi:hypothetical protein SCA03_61060 [Streptomyces cacaoi]|uniref:Uncharacterized protein n=1 Tax=Streptomyces cacaoi TaxID=1898 RepID=A0A4Y3R751_STRCI|nr:hypothetical protein SCA03_61060 [Streptomyces cacaoi]